MFEILEGKFPQSEDSIFFGKSEKTKHQGFPKKQLKATAIFSSEVFRLIGSMKEDTGKSLR